MALSLVPPATIIPCLSGGLLGSLLRTPGWQAAFMAGLLTGFLPCGLVYAYLALATSTNDPLSGLTIMIAFGLGTMPLMILTGADVVGNARDMPVCLATGGLVRGGDGRDRCRTWCLCFKPGQR